MAFSDLTTEQQIQSLLAPANSVLLDYGIIPVGLESINHEYNSTFSVTAADGSRFALRINVNSTRTKENVAAEMSFVNTLAERGTFGLATPLPNLSGDFVTEVAHEETGRDLLCVLFTWLEGEDVGDEPTLEVVFKMGALMAQLHEATKEMVLPVGEELPILDDFMWHEEDLLLGPKSTLTPEEQHKIQSFKNAIEQELALLFKATPKQPIHADLHWWNLKFHNDSLSVFDFDDSGIGLPIQDLATTIYYLDTEEQEQALRDGYSSVRELPICSEYQMKALLLQRRIHLLNYIHETQNPEHREMLPEYQLETLRRIEDFLATKTGQR